MAKQSKQDREFRLSEGRCPIHGGEMGQIDGWYEEHGVSYTIVGCARKDCDFCAKAFSFEGPWELLPEFKFLFKQGKDG